MVRESRSRTFDEPKTGIEVMTWMSFIQRVIDFRARNGFDGGNERL